ncbi:MAG TPA: acyl-CoA synthetase FdrA [bacterium]|nr:acyl-CoA synthetase FdrA [bacterium]
MIVRGTVRRSAYYDSVTLMQAQQSLRRLPGIVEAGVVMGTAANVELLRQAGLDPEGMTATADDLVVVVRADTEERALDALAALDALLARRPSEGVSPAAAEAEYRPRSVTAASRLLPDANLALVSVPGRFAAGVAREALEAGLHVMVFSDNVPVEDEVHLKEMGSRRDRLVMGPDCGTSLIGGAALGFANRVRRGSIGLVGAAGTGLQEVITVIHRRGAGVSHALGTGGRDLSPHVGGMTMSRALAALGRDPGTSVVVLVSKPPDPMVADRILGQAAGIGKPVVVAFVGPPRGADIGGTLHWAGTLEDAGSLAVQLAGGAPGGSWEPLDRWRITAARRAEEVIGRLAPSQRFVRGLFSGGTLCAECVGLLQAQLQPFYSNVPVGAALMHQGAGPSRAHTVLDLGADIFTIGRLHPMLDMSLRSLRLDQEAADPEVAVILLDLVLGEGVHPDPAGALAPSITRARAAAAKAGRSLAVVASVCGTDQDPQHRARQVERLEAAGVLVEDTNARAGVLAGMIASRGTDISRVDREAAGPAPRESRSGAASGGGESGAGRDPHGRGPAGGEDALINGPPRVVNAGLAIFGESLRAQGVPVIDVDWRPPAGGDREMMDLLERLR